MSAPQPEPTTTSTPTAGSSSATKTSPSGGTSGSFDANSTISSVSDLQSEAPQVWNAICQGIAENICNQMKKQQDHLKQIMDEARRDSGG